MRYEGVGPDADVGVYEADEIESGHRALVIGDPEGTALVVIGERAAIVRLLARAKQTFVMYPTQRIAITDSDGNMSVKNEVTGEFWTPITAAGLLRYAAADGAVLEIEVREG